MAKEPQRWYFLISKEWLDDFVSVQGVASLLDMMRYDRAEVESNGPSNYYTMSVPGTLTVRRWESYGFKLVGPWPSRVGIPYELTKWAEGQVNVSTV